MRRNGLSRKKLNNSAQITFVCPVSDIERFKNRVRLYMSRGEFIVILFFSKGSYVEISGGIFIGAESAQDYSRTLMVEDGISELYFVKAWVDGVKC